VDNALDEWTTAAMTRRRARRALCSTITTSTVQQLLL
jgi:hypothetical protein